MTESGPLAGILVLDLTHFLAGPYATIALSDLGADVIKVEDPGHPDEARKVGPYFHGDSLYFESLNWGKRSLAVNLSAPDGHHIFLELVKSADVVLDNFKPGVMTRLGLGHEQLSAVNDRIISCSLSGFGAVGAYSARPGYDYTIQARAGVMSMTGEPDGPPGKAGISYVDHSGGLTAALGIVAAIVERERTAIGRHVDLALYDLQISMLTYLAAWNLNEGYTPKRQANGSHPSIVPAETFQAKDGHLSLFVGNDSMWRRFQAAFGDETLADQDLDTNAGRIARRESLIERLQTRFSTQSTSYWTSKMESAGVPCEPINELGAALADEHLRSRSLITTSTRSDGTAYRHVRGPIPLDTEHAHMPAPSLGAHTRSIVASLGFNDAQIDKMISDGVIVGTAPESTANRSVAEGECAK